MEKHNNYDDFEFLWTQYSQVMDIIQTEFVNISLTR